MNQNEVDKIKSSIDSIGCTVMLVFIFLFIMALMIIFWIDQIQAELGISCKPDLWLLQEGKCTQVPIIE
jgi:hypothetical protein